MSNELIEYDGETQKENDKVERKWLRRFIGIFSLTTVVALASIASAMAAWYGQFNLAEQFDRKTTDYQHERFSEAISGLSVLMDEINAVSDTDFYDPVVIVARRSGLVFALDGSISAKNSFTIDEQELALKPNQFLVRLQIPVTVSAGCGGTEVAYQAVNDGSGFLVAYQRARQLEAQISDRVLSSEYLTLSRFAFAFAGIHDASEYLRKAVAATDANEDGPAKALMQGEIAAIKVMYQSEPDQAEGRKLFHEAENFLLDDGAVGTAVCLVNLYQTWAQRNIMCGIKLRQKTPRRSSSNRSTSSRHDKRPRIDMR